MIAQLSNLNWISILIAFVVYTVLGGLWFTVFFKKLYAVSLGKENNLPEKLAPIFVFGPMVCTLIVTITSALLIYTLEIDTYSKAIQFALVVGTGYLVANTFNIAINPNIPNPIRYGMVSGCYHLAGIFMVSIIIVAMQ